MLKITEGCHSCGAPDTNCITGQAQESSEEVARSLLWRVVDVNRWLRQLHKVELAFQDWAERFWQV